MHQSSQELPGEVGAAANQSLAKGKQKGTELKLRVPRQIISHALPYNTTRIPLRLLEDSKRKQTIQPQTHTLGRTELGLRRFYYRENVGAGEGSETALIVISQSTS